MTLQRALKMPDWPARMSEDMAATYLGISPSTLRAGSASGRYPRPIRDGKRVLYSRHQLDRFVMAQFGIPIESQEGVLPSYQPRRQGFDFYDWAPGEIRLVTGHGPWEDSGPTYRMSEVLHSRGVAHSVDDWGPDGGHDWPYWKRQMDLYVGRLF